jgi:hypothetical protein
MIKPLFWLLPQIDNEQESAVYLRNSHLANKLSGIDVYLYPRMQCEEEILFDLSSYSTLLMIFTICNVFFDEIFTWYIGMKIVRASVVDPDPCGPVVFGPPRFGSVRPYLEEISKKLESQWYWSVPKWHRSIHWYRQMNILYIDKYVYFD